MTPAEIVFMILFIVFASALIWRIIAFIDNLIRFRRTLIEEFRYTNTILEKRQKVIFGDSITEFYRIQEYFPNIQIINRGIANDKTYQLLDRLDTVIPLNPKQIYIQIGTNDMSNGASPKKIAKRIAQIVDELQSELVDTKIFLISIYPITRKKSIFSPIICALRTNKKIRSTNKLIEKISKDKKCEYIDIYSHLVNKKGQLVNDYSVDGLHITHKGYKIISDILAPYLKEKC